METTLSTSPFLQVLILTTDETRSDGGQIDLYRKHWSPVGLSPCPG